MRLLLVLLGTFVLQFNALTAQIISSKMSLNHAYARNVKSLDEFMSRFNGHEFHPDVPDDSMKRITNILSLVNPQIKIDGMNKRSRIEFLTVFAEKSAAWHGELSAISDNLWTSASCEFSYGDKTIPITIILQQEKKADNQIRWAIVGISGLKNAGFYTDKYLTISPADHELGFISFEDYFNSNRKSVPGMRSKSRNIDELSMFLGLIQSQKLKFKVVKDIAYHFLDIPGYIFRVESSKRPEDIGGWFINHVEPATEFEKMEYLNNLFGFNGQVH